ncbi:MAG: bifunctional UDP-sugar hydrolase/5'-nucleotidase [Melioribacteraceae bacterium]|nr:MAG: bifunctional UDP-sugar hydrolase/5'-nucleotidase [Melioribacteraceae bacterium]
MKQILILILLFISIEAQTVTLKIIETSDIHGQVFPYDFINDKPSQSSLAQISTYVKQERTKENQHVILLDNGDILQGQPVVYYYNFEQPDTTHILASIMNYMNYDAATIGNHDIEAGHHVYDKLVDEFNFPWLAANAVDEEIDEPYFKPYKIIEKEGIKIAVLGLITPHIPHWLPENIWEGMYFEDMIESAQKWVNIIKEKENPDLLVGLFHAGIDYTYNGATADTYKNENASQLVAEKVDGFDIIFVGHDHQGWNKFVKNNFGKEVLILGTKGYASSIAEAVVEMNYNNDSKQWESTLVGNIVETKDYTPDPDFMKMFEYAYDKTKQYVSKRIGTITKTIYAEDALFGDSDFSDLIHTIQLELTEADVSFTAPLSMSSEIDSGKIFVRDMFNLYKYENLLYTITLTGQEIKDYLEYSYSIWFNEMKNEDDHLLLFEKDETGKIIWSERSNSPMLQNRYYNFDTAEGIEYIVDVSKPVGNRVEIIKFTNGNIFELDKTYKAAVNSYRGNGGGNHLTKGAGIDHDKLSERIITSTEKDLRYYLMKWIEKKVIVEINKNDNWKVVPDNWYEAAKKRDREILFR